MRPSWTHDALIARANELAADVPLAAAADAFLASLHSASLAHRPALITALLAHRVPPHPFDASRYRTACAECGEPAEGVLPPVDRRRGEVLPGSLSHAVAYLERFGELTPVAPTPADRATLGAILALVGTLPGEAAEATLNAAIGKAKLLRGDKHRRRFVLETLGYAGVLETPERRGLLDAWVPFFRRDERPSERVELDAPLGFWRAAHGVNGVAVARWFPGVRLAPPRAPEASPPARTKPREPKPRRETKLVHGDVLELARGASEPLHVVVTALVTDASGRHPVVSLLEAGVDPLRAVVTSHRVAVPKLLETQDPRQGYRRIGHRADVPTTGVPYAFTTNVVDAVRWLARAVQGGGC